MRLAACVLAPIAGLGCTVINPGFDPSTESWSSQDGTASDPTAATTSAASPTTSTASVSTGESDVTTTAGETSTGAVAATSTGTTLGGTEGSTGTPSCEPEAPPNPVADEAVIAAAYADDYRAYVLGPVPGIPAGSDLGGMAIHDADVDTLVIAGNAETPEGTLYEIGVERGPCGHIIDFVGEAKAVAMTPHVSDLLFVSGGLLFYTEWPKNHIAQLLPGASTPDLRTNLGDLGITMSAGGFGLVPPGIEGAGQLRVLTWNTGDWYHLDRSANGELFDLGNAVKITQVAAKSGGLAYVPEGSPGFDAPHVMLSESEAEKLSVYQVDAAGDPLLESRVEFLSQLPFAYTTYFEPVTGDLLVSTIEAPQDQVYIVQGFAPPPPLQP